MRIVFFGTPPFAAKILKDLLDNGHEIVAVVTKPDRPKGRSKTPIPSAVKEFVLEMVVSPPIYQPKKASAEEFIEALAAHEADLFVVVAYGEILRQKVLDLPRLGCLNVHASLLPEYRGAAPVQRCLMDGKTETGVTIMHMVLKMDAGEIITQKKLQIPLEMSLGELEENLCELGSLALQEVLKTYSEGCVGSSSQDENLVTYASKVELEDCELRFDQPAIALHNLIRGSNPRPGAWAWVDIRGKRKRLKIWSSSVLENFEGVPGDLSVLDDRLVIACGKGALSINVLQLEGGRRLTSKEFLRGFSLDQIIFLFLK